MESQTTVIPTNEPFVNVPVLRTFIELESLLDWVQSLGGCVLGGIVRWMCSPKREPVPPGDIDIYARDEASFDALRAYIENTYGAEIYRENPMALSYNRIEGSVLPALQLIKPVHEGRVVATGDFEEILRNFDFTVVRIGLVSSTMALADPMFLEDEKTMRLRLRNIHCPISSTARVTKYCRKGYYAPPSELLRLFLDWDDRNEIYKADLIELFMRSETGEITEEEVDRLEALLRID